MEGGVIVQQVLFYLWGGRASVLGAGVQVCVGVVERRRLVVALGLVLVGILVERVLHVEVFIAGGGVCVCVGADVGRRGGQVSWWHGCCGMLLEGGACVSVCV